MIYKSKYNFIQCFQYGIEEQPEWFTDRVRRREVILHNEKYLPITSTYCLIYNKGKRIECKYGDYILLYNNELVVINKIIFKILYERVE